MRNRTSAIVVFGAALAGACSTAQAGFVILGDSGWRAEWDPSLDLYVEVNFVSQTSDAVFVQMSEEFAFGPPFSGAPLPTIPFVFRQIAWPAVTNIVIDDMIVTNSTGEDWDAFHFFILDTDAAFDPAATLASGSGDPIGFSVDPFENAAFLSDNQRLSIWNGLLADGQNWFPGNGPDEGQLWINVEPHENAPFTVFTFKQVAMPEPASLALLALGGAALARRRG